MTIDSKPTVRVGQLWSSLSKNGVVLQVLKVCEYSKTVDVLILTNSDYVQAKLDAGIHGFTDRRGTASTIPLATLISTDPQMYVPA